MRALPRSTFLLAGLLLVANAGAQSTQVYQWKDASGVTHYSDSPPPPGAKASDRRINGRKAAETQQVAAQPAESEACTKARYNLKLLSSEGAQVIQQDTDGDGKPDTTLDATARANQKELAAAAVKALCPAQAAG